MPIIGYNTSGGGNATTESNWALEAIVGSSYRYTATTGDTVTQFAVHGSGAAGVCEMGIYTYVGGVPVTRVGAANVTIAAGAVAWHTATVSIALTGGVTYVVAIDYAVTHGWDAYFDNPGGSMTSVRDTDGPLPATWSENFTSGFITSFYATVTAGGGGVTGSGAVTAAADTTSGSATVTAPSITGTGAVVEAHSTTSATGTYTGPLGGAGTITNSGDTVAGTGVYTAPKIGVGAVAAGTDTITGSGTYTAPVAAAIIGTNADPSAWGTGDTQENWINEATVGAAYRYTASTGDVVTSMSVYGGGTGDCELGVYTFTGGVPVTRVGTVTMAIGSATQWWTQSCSFALTGGVTYVVAIDYYVTTSWTMRFTPIGAGTTSSSSAIGALPATWVQNTTSSDLIPYYASVTGAAPSITGTATVSNGNDTVTATAVYTPPPITGTAALVEARGSVAGVGVYGTNVTATATIVNAGDTVFAAGAYSPAAITGSGAITNASSTVTGTGTFLPLVTGTGTIVEARDVAAGSSFGFPYPKTISGRKILDQSGGVYLAKTVSSWRMAARLSNANITQALEDVASRGFNGVTVWMGGSEYHDGSNRYTNQAGQNFWTGTPWASSLGAAWASVDWLIQEASRLELTVHFSFCGGFDVFGCGPDWEAASDAQMVAAGTAIATRYLIYPHIVWHIMFDSPHIPSDTRGQKINKLFEGINSVETTSLRPVRWIEALNGTSTNERGWYNPTGTGGATAGNQVRVSINCIYQYVSDSTAVMETGYAELTVATGDCEPPYVGAGHYSGNQQQQLRERNYAVFLEGGCLINWGHEDFWPFGATNFYSDGETWDTVVDDTETVEAGHAWALIDAYCADATWAPSGFVTTGEGSGDVKAAVGRSDTAGLAYFPDSRSVVVSTAFMAAPGNIRIRWYDPTTGVYTMVVESEAPSATRPVTYPSNHADGTSDWVLVIDTADAAPPSTNMRLGSTVVSAVYLGSTLIEEAPVG